MPILPPRAAAILTRTLVVCLLALVSVARPACEAAEPQFVRLAADKQSFVLTPAGEPFVPWGFNYVGREGELAEESWQGDWARVETDFRAMRALGANVVRWHLQLPTYLRAAEEIDRDQLARLRRLLDLARDEGLYLDLTGLGGYR